MKSPLSSKRAGFTLLELSIAIMVGIATGSMVLILFKQQLAFLDVYKRQSFLTEEAPIISMYVSRLVGKADRFRLHDTVADALSNSNQKSTGECNVVLLNFRQPDGTMRATILSYEDRGTGFALYYYVVPVSGVLGAPQWAVTKTPSRIRFSMVSGVLRMKVTGPSGEEITYSGTMQL